MPELDRHLVFLLLYAGHLVPVSRFYIFGHPGDSMRLMHPLNLVQKQGELHLLDRIRAAGRASSA